MTGQDVTKGRLLEAAGEEFAEKGFEQATVRAICGRAGANVAAVNYHFGDKEELYKQAVFEAHRCGKSEMLPEEEFFRGSPAEQLRRYVHHFLGDVLAMRGQDDWHHTLMLRELLKPTAAAEALVREVIRPRFERLLKVLRSILPAADGRKLHATAFSIVGQCLHYRVAHTITRRLIGPEAFAALDLDFISDHITRFTLAALGLAPPLDGAGGTEGEPVGAGAGDEA